LDYKDPKPFRFKQFEVHHHLSTFKVNTDGVLLGCSVDVSDCKTALDIGTGTGMISLILAQRSESLRVTGIENDPVSASQAKYNADISPFAERVQIVTADCFSYDYPHHYDMIVCNPPYFTGGTLPSDSNLSQAKHSSETFLPRLISLATRLLNPPGQFHFLYPYSDDKQTVQHVSQSKLHLTKKTLLKSYADSEPYACLYTLGHRSKAITEDMLVLYLHDRAYTQQHQELVREFITKSKKA